MDETISSVRLQRLLNVNSATLSTLASKGVVVRAERRWHYALEASVRGYISRLQAAARGRGGDDAQEARARLATAQTALTEARAAQIRGELVPAAEVEALWTRKLRAFRNRILAIPNRLRDLTPKANATLMQELRTALTELAS